ncbi:MAG: HU family DNA-binding protein [Desulfohalobiaceae bacterium]
MNKSQLIRTLAERRSISLDEASTIVNTFFEGIKDTLLQDQRVELRGFGSFKMKHYEGYQGRNPSTGEIVQVQPKRLPFFRVGKDLKEFLNE